MAKILEYSIGSLWAGQASESIDDLFSMLEREPLDPRFEKFGNFYENYPEMCDGTKSEVPHYFTGNFYLVSCGFRVETDDDALAEKILAAIRANQATPAYQEAKADRKAYTLRLAAEERAAEKAKKAVKA